MNTEPDFVSDLADGTADDTVPVHQNDVGQVSDTPVQPPAKVGKTDKQATPPKATDSLRDQISSALKGEENTPPVASQDGKPRAADGKFVSPGTDPAATDPAATDPAATAASPVLAPNGLSAAELQLFNQLPAELQAGLARTMEGLNERVTRYSGYEQLEQLIGPRREAWALNGVTEVQAINQLLALSDFAAKSPAEFIQYFAQQRNIDLEDIIYGAEPADPVVQSLEQKIQQLEQQVSGFSTQQQQTAHNSVVNEIIQFAEAKGADGTPLRPYFEELGTEVLPFIEAVRNANPSWSRDQILQEAYERACWGSPTVRAKLQADMAAREDAQRIQSAQAAAAKARSAGASIPTGVPSVNPASGAVGTGSLRDTIKAAVEAAN